MKRALVPIAASAAVYTIVAWCSAVQLPVAGVPMQVNSAGEVNRSATRAGAISFFVGLGSFLLLLAIVTVVLCALLPIRWLNMPHKEYWRVPEREATARRMVVWDAAVFLSMPMLALSSIPVNVALAAHDPTVSAWWVIAPFLAWLAAMAGYTIWMVAHRYRPPPAARSRD